MSWSKDTTIWCDAEDCYEWRRFNTSRAADAWHGAKEAGWTGTKNDSRCPECSQ